MSAAADNGTNAPDHFDAEAVELGKRLVRVFGIRRARKIAFQTTAWLKHEYGRDDQ